VAITLLCVWTLYFNVSDFSPVRIKLVPQGTEQEMSVSLVDAARVPDSHLVLICRLRNPTPKRIEIEAHVGAEIIKRIDIEPDRRTRVDLVWIRPSELPPGYSMRLIGSEEGWLVDSVELANLHGFSRGLLNLFVLPAGQRAAPVPLWLLSATITAVVVVFLVCSLAGCAPMFSLWSSIPALVMASLFCAVELAHRMTSFRIVLSTRTLGLGLLCLVGPYLSAVAALTWRRIQMSDASRRKLIIAGAGLLSLCFFGSAMLQTLSDYRGNYSGFLHITHTVAARAPFLRDRPDLVQRLTLYDDGYDGQFMYLMAFDPLLQRFRDAPERYREVVDLPPYRYGRIGYSLLTKVVSGADASRYPPTMLWLIVGAHFGIGALLTALALHHGATPALSLFYLAIPGFMPSLLFGLPESLAVLGLLGGLWFSSRHRPLRSGLCLAASLLVRETGLILAVTILAGAARRRRALTAAVAFVPLIAWRAYVALRFFRDFGWGAVFVNPGDFGIPFRGLTDLMTAGLDGTHVSSEIPAAFGVPLLLAGALALAIAACRERTWLAFSALGYALLAICLNYGKIWTHVPSGERGTIELFLCLLLLLVVHGNESRRLARALVTFFILVAFYAFLASPEAGVSRAALLVVR
jgi:hypothetical protein